MLPIRANVCVYVHSCVRACSMTACLSIYQMADKMARDSESNVIGRLSECQVIIYNLIRYSSSRAKHTITRSSREQFDCFIVRSFAAARTRRGGLIPLPSNRVFSHRKHIGARASAANAKRSLYQQIEHSW